MKALLQWVSLLLAVAAFAISALTYSKVQNLRSGDQAAVEAANKLRQDIATYIAQKRAVTTQEAQALQQGLAQDLKKFEQVSNIKPLDLEQVFASPSASASPTK